MSTTTTDCSKAEKSRSLLKSLSFDQLAKAQEYSLTEDLPISPTQTNNKMGNSDSRERDVEEGNRRKRRRSRSRDTYNDDPKGADSDYYTLEDLVDEKIYVTKQNSAPCARIFAFVQFIILVAMMFQCKVAPFNINPMIGPYPDALDYWGGKNAYKIIEEKEYYRLVTPILLHAGVLHLFGNVAVQLDQGAFYEREWGSLVWLIIYITSAIGSSILSCCFMPDNVSVGSSGAVMGLFGGKLAEVFCRACESDKTTQGKVGHFVRKEQFSESMCAVTIVMLFSFVPFVDWAAHLGGLIAGFCVGITCFSCWVRSKVFVLLWFLVGGALTAAFYSISIIYMLEMVDPIDDLKDVCEYYKQFFEGYECNCQLDNNN